VIKAPKHLSRAAKKLWRSIIDDYAITDDAGLKILQVSLEAYDRCQESREIISSTGLLLKNRFDQPVQNPLLSIERDSRSAFLTGLKNLNLDIEPLRDAPGRPGGR